MPVQSRRLIISITQTNDEASDIAYLHRLIAILRDFPGEDDVSLRISNEDKATHLRLSDIRINYCPELDERLAELVGEEGLKLEVAN